MKLTKDESRALAFVAFLLVLSAAARYAKTPAPITASGPEVDLKALEQASQAKLDAKSRPRARGRSRAHLSAAATPPAGLDPNFATAEELAALPKISLSMAQKIVSSRDSGMRFEAADDLGRIPGITRKTVDAIAIHLTLPRREEPRENVAASPRRPLAASGRGAPTAGIQMIDLNTATPEQLESVPGIGPGLAKRILEYKTQKGGFHAIDDLLAVKGIGPATLGRLRSYLTVRP